MRIGRSILLVIAATLSSAAISFGQGSGPATGTISGRVTANAGSVVALRVKARDSERRVAYVVFTNQGRYHIFNLLPGKYAVSVLETNFDSTSVNVALKAGETKTADIVLTAKAPPQAAEFVDFDTLWPPGPGRDLMLQNCLGCHSLEHIPFQTMGPWDEQEWRSAVNTMFAPSPTRAKLPVSSPETISVEQRETITKYLANTFGKNAKRLDLRRAPVPLDENVLTRAMYIQYELDPSISLQENTTYVDRKTSTIWLVGENREKIVAVDINDAHGPIAPARARVWAIPHVGNASPVAYGITGSMGLIYWAQMGTSSIGELNPQTGEIHRYDLPTPGAPHTADVDSKGNVWFSEMYTSNKIGRFDPRTKKITEWNPSPKYRNASYYGITVDNQDRVWSVGISGHIVVGYDPRTDEWTTYPTPTQPSGPRRITSDSKGFPWFTESLGDALGMLDPETGKITEYRVPLPRAGEHSVQADGDDTIWVGLRTYNVLARFDRKTKKFDYFHYPVPFGHSSKLERDAQGNIVMQISGICRGNCAIGQKYPNVVTVFKPNGNVVNSSKN